MSTAQPTTEPTAAPEADEIDNDTTPETPDAPQSDEPGSGTADALESGEDAGSEPKGSQADDPRLRSARNDAAKYRTRASKAETDLDAFKQQVGKLFGFVSDDEATDPKKLTTQLESAVKDANEARVELAVYRTAGKDVDADALLDSRAFSAAISKLDLTADDFAAQVAAEISKAVEKNPNKFRLTPVAEPPKPPKRSGADTGSGKGENSGQLTYAQYQALSPSERVKAVQEGRANQILGRRK
ncbi:hypothetical protein [Nocardia terpenica]|uniref:Scaffolding protein n=1 Tax=Nocardia terpenica TaxID=455432 RepID=A0A164PM16_9NOCA|nr:hypothetical protein [Nocardia terpenica]KZM75751.1 hypothetical protein AWN90_20655 [Nocardia terpenica]NQE86264.1 hypothetical protein [Nocardia terpenica]